MKKMNPVIHFEMPADDRKRMARFYTKAFGWEAKDLGPKMGNYVTVMTTQSDRKGPKKPGAINGGFFQRTDDMPMQYPSVVISVEDIDAHVKKVKAAGGTVLGRPMDIPGVGAYVSFVDTEGNRASMLEPIMHTRATPAKAAPKARAKGK